MHYVSSSRPVSVSLPSSQKRQSQIFAQSAIVKFSTLARVVFFSSSFFRASRQIYVLPTNDGGKPLQQFGAIPHGHRHCLNCNVFDPQPPPRCSRCCPNVGSCRVLRVSRARDAAVCAEIARPILIPDRRRGGARATRRPRRTPNDALARSLTEPHRHHRGASPRQSSCRELEPSKPGPQSQPDRG